MEDVFEIVNFYQGIKDKNLFPESVFRDEIYHQIDRDIDQKNDDFFNLVKRNSTRKDFGCKSLEFILSDLSKIHHEISHELTSRIIPQVDNTPLFRYEIKFQKTPLTLAFSKVAIIEGISEIYWFLEDHFSADIKLGDKLMTYRFDPPYVDEVGYIKHVYLKFLDDDFLKNELYNYKHYWVEKINEFLKYLPSKINVSLPIDYLTRRFGEREENESDDTRQRNKLQDYLNSVGVISEGKDPLDSLLEELAEESKKRAKEVDDVAEKKKKPLFTIMDPFKDEATDNDYIKELYYSLKDHFELFPKNSFLTLFRLLFKDSVLPQKIEVSDAKKLLAVIKFLKTNGIVKPHYKFQTLMTENFIEPYGKLIPINYLRGSKTQLTPKEERQLKNLFGLNS
ncbi:hypothetical protein [Sunxiuqinia sp. sy24]|uniref:hypothetical protein n=1 Tax=Sunxiuqinia sp. sy24 TaxID=3461495 RepID=UPI0040455B16